MSETDSSAAPTATSAPVASSVDVDSSDSNSSAVGSGSVGASSPGADESLAASNVTSSPSAAPLRREPVTAEQLATSRVYVGNLSYSTSWQTLKDLFRDRLGDVAVSHVDILQFPSGRSKGAAIVELDSKENAARAINTISETEVEGRKIFIREDRESKGFGLNPLPPPNVLGHHHPHPHSHPNLHHHHPPPPLGPGGYGGLGGGIGGGGGGHLAGPPPPAGAGFHFRNAPVAGPPGPYHVGPRGYGGPVGGIGGGGGGGYPGANGYPPPNGYGPPPPVGIPNQGYSAPLGGGYVSGAAAGRRGVSIFDQPEYTRNRLAGPPRAPSFDRPGPGGYPGAGYAPYPPRGGPRFGPQGPVGAPFGAGAGAPPGPRNFPEPVEGSSIYLGNLSWRTSWQDLKDLCNQYGVVVRADVIRDRDTNRSKGFGIVRYSSAAEAQSAINALHDTEFQGRQLIVRLDRRAPGSVDPNAAAPGGDGTQTDSAAPVAGGEAEAAAVEQQQ